MKQMDSIQPGQQQSRMLLSAVGTVWMLGWCLQKRGQDLSTLLLVLLSGTAIFLWALCDYRTWHVVQKVSNSAAARRFAGSTTGRGGVAVLEGLLCISGLLFNLVFVLDLIGYPELLPESVMLLMAVACLAMGKILQHRSHYLTGSALAVVALVYSSMEASQPNHAASCFAAGSVFWVSALYGLLLEHFDSRSALPARREPFILSLH